MIRTGVAIFKMRGPCLFVSAANFDEKEELDTPAPFAIIALI